jgi:hypothetical protein
MKQHLFFGVFLSTALFAGALMASTDASKILEAGNIKGGLIVHIGCGDGKLTTSLPSTMSKPLSITGINLSP